MRRDLLIPALVGLGLFAQNGENGACHALCNNTTMILLLFVVLQDREEIAELKCKCENGGCNGGYYNGNGAFPIAPFFGRGNGCGCGCKPHNHCC